MMMNSLATTSIYIHTLFLFFNTQGICGVHEVSTYDPESLYSYFKGQAISNGRAYMAEASGLTYFTPITEKLMRNGIVSKQSVLDAYNSFNNEDKDNLYNAQKQMQECWNNVKKISQSSQDSYEYCYFNSYDCGASRTYESLMKGDTHLELISCLSQKAGGITDTLSRAASRRSKRLPPNHGLHIEAGGGIAFGLYASGSTGIGLSLNNAGNHISTYTSCLGLKSDISVGGSFSVSYFLDMDDMLGEAVTVEIGVDIPKTELGIDLLLHFSLGSSTGRLLTGFGFSLGIGVGLNPLDVAASSCNTKKIADYKDSVRIAIGPYWGWTCSRRYLGVVSEGKYICCPEKNPDTFFCSGNYCWFEATKCPHTPQELASIKDNIGVAIIHSSCPGQTYIPEGQGNRNECINKWKLDFQAKYVYYKHDSRECWFGYTWSIDTCVWAPSPLKSEMYARARQYIE